MKKIYAVFLSTLLFTSCLNDFLDVDLSLIHISEPTRRS